MREHHSMADQNFRGQYQHIRGVGRNGWNRRSMDDGEYSYLKSSPNYGPNGSIRGRENWQKRSGKNRNFKSRVTTQRGYNNDVGTLSFKQNDKITPHILAKNLAEFSDFSSSLLNLFDKLNFNHREVKKVVEENSHSFQLNEEIVTLKPNVKLCDGHIGSDGCETPASCKDLHICPKFVTNTCREGRNCLYGHIWKTNHNNPILETHFLTSITNSKITDLFSAVGATFQADELRICADYNNGKCDTLDCNELHLCLPYLAKTCDTNEKCKFNHNIGDKVVFQVLDMHGISLNESPRDLLINVSKCPLVKVDIESFISRNKTLRLNGVDNKSNSSQNKDNLSSANYSHNQDPSSPSTTQQQPPIEVPQKKSAQTLWSNYLEGDVAVVEICYNSVENYCPYEEKGCWRLHCPQHFHWQIKETGKCWYNLRLDQVLALEKAFCDPKETNVKIPPLDPSTLEPKLKCLLLTMQGRKQWEADFNTMKLTLQGHDKDLELRRLCTEDTSNEIPEPCIFAWYFCDINKNWIEYGNVDSAGKEKLKSSIDSDDIEKHFQQTPTTSLVFKNASFVYKIDTVGMFQTNMRTNVKREIRRRPVPHFKENDEKEKIALKREVPSFWEPMNPDERVRRVPLSSSSPEYVKVFSYFSNQGGNFNVLKIERVQNPFLWRAFQNKIEEMTSVYKSSASVNIQQLFHGTHAATVPKICEENFDWRLHGTNAGQAYGSGTYFSPLPATSYGYTSPDPSGCRFMFVAQVAVGSITLGSANMTTPPINPLTNIPFNSSGNNLVNPSIVVKYDKQEYFPEYILTLS